MIALKYLLEIIGFGLLAGAAGIVIFDLLTRYRSSRLTLTETETEPPVMESRWRLAGRLAMAGVVPLLLGLSIQVVPAGRAGIRISQISGTLPDTLYPGFHLVLPLVQHVETYDVRDQIFQTALAVEGKKDDSLKVQTKEGLSVGLAVTVRFRLDPRRLAYVNANLPQPPEQEIVPPVVASAFRELTPNYLVHELFATKREQDRKSVV